MPIELSLRFRNHCAIVLPHVRQDRTAAAVAAAGDDALVPVRFDYYTPSSRADLCPAPAPSLAPAADAVAAAAVDVPPAGPLHNSPSFSTVRPHTVAADDRCCASASRSRPRLGHPRGARSHWRACALLLLSPSSS